MIIDISFNPFTIDEYMCYEKEHDNTIFKSQGIWWRAVNPFFCVPAWHFSSFPAGERKPALVRSLLGYSHLVPEQKYSNSVYYILCMDKVQEYQLRKIRRQMQQDIRRGLNRLQIRTITSFSELINGGHQVYLSWFERIKNIKGQKYLQNKKFISMIEAAILSKKKIILGAFLDEMLIAYLIGVVVDQKAFIEKCYAMTDYLAYHPTQALLYTFINACKNNENISLITLGQASFERPSLNSFLIRQGFEMREYPAFIKINQATKTLVRILLPRKYHILANYLKFIKYRD